MLPVPDNPIIRNCERTGWPDGKEPVYPKCPVCGKECETIYYSKDREPVGCDVCIRTKDAWDEPACFPGDEN